MFHKYFVPSCSLLLYFLIWCLFRSRSFEFWQCLLYQYFPFIIIVFPVLRNFCLPRIVNIFLSVFSQKLDAISFYKGLCYMWGYISCMIRSRGQSSFSFSIMNIYLFWHRVKKQNNFFFFFSIHCSGDIWKSRDYMWVHFWLCFIRLSISYCLDYCNLTLSFEIV